MAKQVFGSATDIFSFDATEYEVTGVSFDQEAAEVNTTDTGTTAGTTEALAGRVSSKFTISLIQDTGDSDAALASSATAILNFGVKNYTGTAILYTKSTTGEVDGRIERTYTGRFNGTVTEA